MMIDNQELIIDEHCLHSKNPYLQPPFKSVAAVENRTND